MKDPAQLALGSRRALSRPLLLERQHAEPLLECVHPRHGDVEALVLESERLAAFIQRLKARPEPSLLEAQRLHLLSERLQPWPHLAIERVHAIAERGGQIISKPQGLLELGKQDFIYCIGLFDYLHKHIASRLLGGLYAALEPGGELLVGNAAWPTEAFFAPEFVLDWKLLYRSRQDMAALAATLPAEAQSEVVLEPGGAYFVMRVRKP